jgi:glycosyltransferase involved in cell wall biosynthesis
LKVLLLSHYFESHAGGIELVVSRLAREFAARGVEVRWAATEPRRQPRDSPDPVGRVPMHSFNLVERVTGLPYPIWTPTSYPALLRAVRWADVVHLHDAIYFGSQLAGAYARRLRKPIVVTQHVGAIPFRSRTYRLLHHVANALFTEPLLRRSDRVVFVSDRVRSELAGVRLLSEPQTIYNGVDTRLFSPVSADPASVRERLGLDPRKTTFLFVGRFSPKKGLARIREAAARLPEIQWVLIGWGNEDPASWRLPNVIVAGRQSQASLPNWYRAADLLVLPSVGEGFPLVVQEAMACGTPCLVSEETRDGCLPARELLFSAGNEGASCTDAANDLAADLSGLADARRRVEEFSRSYWSWTACADAYVRIYRELSNVDPTASAPKPRGR